MERTPNVTLGQKRPSDEVQSPGSFVVRRPARLVGRLRGSGRSVLLWPPIGHEVSNLALIFLNQREIQVAHKTTDNSLAQTRWRVLAARALYDTKREYVKACVMWVNRSVIVLVLYISRVFMSRNPISVLCCVRYAVCGAEIWVL